QLARPRGRRAGLLARRHSERRSDRRPRFGREPAGDASAAVARRRVRVARRRGERRGTHARTSRCDEGLMFKGLVRAFFGQLFASELVTSEMQLHRAMVGPLALLITPAVLAPFQLISTFEMAAIRFPQLLDPMTRVVATIFVTYSMVSIGVIAAVMWDSLSFDRRHAMMLGPLPPRRRTA